MAMYSVKQYVKEIKKEVGNAYYTYYNLPERLRIWSLHHAAIERGYIKRMTTRNIKPIQWSVTYE
jgi:hypothetical protein